MTRLREDALGSQLESKLLRLPASASSLFSFYASASLICLPPCKAPSAPWSTIATCLIAAQQLRPQDGGRALAHFAACSALLALAWNWCACLLAFFGLLRIREYMDAGLRVRDVRFVMDGLDLEVLFSKTSLVRTVVSVSARADDLCPSRALSPLLCPLPLSWSPCSGRRPAVHQFRRRQTRAMSADEFIVGVRQLYARAQPNCPPERYAGHSFRHGGATALRLAGVADSDIQRRGRWRSDTCKGYFDSGSPALRLIATRALLPRAP